MSLFTQLTFTEKVHEHDDVYTFRFHAPHFTHKAGQHSIFLLPNFARPHPFSLTSAPGEAYLSFTTHVRAGSRFKSFLVNMQPGQKILMFGPIMNFTFSDQSNNHVFLAQGIGITPFRSMLTHAHNESLPFNTTLIHVQQQTHTFRGVTEAYATTAYYPTSLDEFRKLASEQDNKSVFYLSGSPKFIASTKKLLFEQGAPKSRIKSDSFLGY